MTNKSNNKALMEEEVTLMTFSVNFLEEEVEAFISVKEVVNKALKNSSLTQTSLI